MTSAVTEACCPEQTSSEDAYKIAKKTHEFYKLSVFNEVSMERAMEMCTFGVVLRCLGGG
jgi:hypothetical protein